MTCDDRHDRWYQRPKCMHVSQLPAGPHPQQSSQPQQAQEPQSAPSPQLQQQLSTLSEQDPRSIALVTTDVCLKVLHLSCLGDLPGLGVCSKTALPPAAAQAHSCQHRCNGVLLPSPCAPIVGYTHVDQHCEFYGWSSFHRPHPRQRVPGPRQHLKCQGMLDKDGIVVCLPFMQNPNPQNRSFYNVSHCTTPHHTRKQGSTKILASSSIHPPGPPIKPSLKCVTPATHSGSPGAFDWGFATTRPQRHGPRCCSGESWCHLAPDGRSGSKSPLRTHQQTCRKLPSGRWRRTRKASQLHQAVSKPVKVLKTGEYACISEKSASVSPSRLAG